MEGRAQAYMTTPALCFQVCSLEISLSLSPVITLLRTVFNYLAVKIASDELCIDSVKSVHFVLLPKFEMEDLRHADAKVYAATHPGVRARGRVNRYNPRLRWKLSRYNPMNRFRLAKYKTTHPVEFQKARARSRFNYMNPLFYIRRIKYNLTHAGRRHHTTTTY